MLLTVGDHQSVDQLTSFFMSLHGIYPAPLSCQSAYLQYATIIRRVRPWSRAYTFGDYLTWAFIPLRRIVPLRGTLSYAFGAALLQGPTHGGLSHMGFHTATASCASSRRSILRLWRGPSPRAYSRGLSHMGFHAAAANCASSRHSILRLWRGPSPRAYARGLSHMGFHAVAASCASSRHSILRLWRGPSPRAYSREEYSSP